MDPALGDRTISASVGIKGVNRHADVVTVQELLNDVPPGEGGPQPPLKVDGIAGPKTNGAIHAFQLKHFGWPGADGRVDPHQRTIAKLNSFRPRTAGLCALRHAAPPNELLDETRNDQWFFQVRAVGGPKPGTPSTYYLGRKSDLVGLPVPVLFHGTDVHFQAPVGRNAAQLQGRGAFSTIRAWNTSGGSAESRTRSRLFLGPYPQVITLDMDSDIELPPPRIDPITGAKDVVAGRSREGDLIRVG